MPSRNLILLMLVLSCVFSSASYGDDYQFTLVDLEKTEKPLIQSMLEHRVIAEKKNQQIFVQITAEWCTPCKKLRASMDDIMLRRAFNGTYIVRVDADIWEDELPEINIDLKAVPVFYALSEEGKATSYTINGGAWGEDIPKNMAPPLFDYFTGR